MAWEMVKNADFLLCITLNTAFENRQEFKHQSHI